MNQELFNINHIYLNVEVANQDEAFKFIANSFIENKISSNFKKCYKGLIEREKEGTTGFNDGIAIPHAKKKVINYPAIFVYSFQTPVEWNSIDGSLVKIAIGLAIPESKYGTEHIKILSSVARKLVDDDFRQQLKTSNNKEEIFKLINAIKIVE